MKSRHRSNGGFTLAEVLVATLLLSIVMTSVYTLFFSVISTWRTEENDEGLHRQARGVLGTLEQEYANVYAGGSQLFEGTRDELTLYVVGQPMDVESGEGSHLMRVQYRFDRANHVLRREEALVEGALPPVVRDANTFERGRIQVGREAEFIVAKNVADFSISYLWIQRPNADYFDKRPEPVVPRTAGRHRLGWGLPQAIEVHLTLRGERDASQTVSVSTRFPTRAHSRQREAWELSRMLEGLR